MAMEGDSRLKLITCSKQGLNSALITIISRSRKSCKICLIHVDKKVPAKIFFFLSFLPAKISYSSYYNSTPDLSGYLEMKAKVL